jgi:tRNA-uridine 2-sulfurtransferase
MKKFLRERINEKKGKIVDREGREIGEHPGQMFFTIGERVRDNKGLKIENKFRKEHSGKLYVAEKKGNTLVVAEDGEEILKRKNVFLINVKLVNGDEKIDGKKFRGRIRHLGELCSGKLSKEKGRWSFVFDKGQEGIAPGQELVFYSGERVVGCGEIRI